MPKEAYVTDPNVRSYAKGLDALDAPMRQFLFGMGKGMVSNVAGLGDIANMLVPGQPFADSELVKDKLLGDNASQAERIGADVGQLIPTAGPEGLLQGAVVATLRGGAKMHEVGLEAARGWKAGERLNFWEFPKDFNYKEAFDDVARRAFGHVRRTRFGRQDENYVGESVRLLRDKKTGATYMWDAASVTHDELIDILNSSDGKKLSRDIYDAYVRDITGWNNLTEWTDAGVKLERYDVEILGWLEKARVNLPTYHGSRHLFGNVTPDAPYGKFDLSKIGTGEGNQTFGYGLYLSETPDVARKYPRGKGHLYTVDLPDEHIAKMLDWDAPLSEQPNIVQRAAAELGMSGDNITGKDVYGRAGTNWMLKQPDLGSGVYVGRDKAASEYFRALGIPGIRYLDKGSRAAGEGTRNFVIFDPEVVKILSRE